MKKAVKKNNESSPFSTGLKGLMDQTGLLSRAEWAYMLNVSGAAISQWLNDKHAPKAKHLSLVVDFIKNRADSLDSNAKDLLVDFELMGRKPIQIVSPIHDKFKECKTIGEYLLKPRFNQLTSLLGRLDSSMTGSILSSFIKISRTFVINRNNKDKLLTLLTEFEDYSNRFEKITQENRLPLHGNYLCQNKAIPSTKSFCVTFNDSLNSRAQSPFSRYLGKLNLYRTNPDRSFDIHGSNSEFKFASFNQDIRDKISALKNSPDVHEDDLCQTHSFGPQPWEFNGTEHSDSSVLFNSNLSAVKKYSSRI